jgi:superfamily II DNA or RNA helicase
MVWHVAKVAILPKEQLFMAIGFGNKEIKSSSLRQWQEEAKLKCLVHFEDGKRVWVQESVTGGGKTHWAEDLAIEKHADGSIDLTIVIVPSIGIMAGWLNAFKGKLNATAGPNYQSDTEVWVTTYAGYKAICNALPSRMTKGYLLIVDEYHHAEREAQWGQAVETLGKGAKHILMLSGTPWRTQGTIALLEKEHNIHKRPYYSENGTIEPDHYYRYSEDLTSKTRATVPIRFEFEPAEAIDKDTGEIYRLPLDTDDWWTLANERCKEPLGKYVSITSKLKPFNALLEGKEMQRNLIAKGFKMLEQSRVQIKNACGVSDVSIMHIACACIADARSVESYICATFPWFKAETIVSEDASSAKRIEEIQRACRQGSHDRPDVILSVGMISEGVDIPAIKVTVYFNKIMTLLYLIQLIGRGQRRIRLDKLVENNINNGYADKNNSIDETPSYFLAPAHPYIIWMARQIEEDIRQARQLICQDSGDAIAPSEKPERTSKEYVVNSAGESRALYRGNAINKLYLTGAIDKLVDHPNAADFAVNTHWGNYLNSLIMDGKEDFVETMVRQKCQDMQVDYKDVISNKTVKSELSYDQQSKLLSEDAHALVHRIRNTIEPFKSEEDNGKAYPKVWGKLNKGLGIGNFSKATLEEKRKWINFASAWLVQRSEVAQ